MSLVPVFHEPLFVMDAISTDLEIFLRRYHTEFARICHQAILGPLTTDIVKSFINDVITATFKWFQTGPHLPWEPSLKNLQHGFAVYFTERLPPVPGRPAGPRYSDNQKSLRAFFIAHLKNRVFSEGRVSFFCRAPDLAPFFSRKRHTIRNAIMLNMPRRDIIRLSAPPFQREPSPLSISSSASDNMTLSNTADRLSVEVGDHAPTCAAIPGDSLTWVDRTQFYNQQIAPVILDDSISARVKTHKRQFSQASPYPSRCSLVGWKGWTVVTKLPLSHMRVDTVHDLPARTTRSGTGF